LEWNQRGEWEGDVGVGGEGEESGQIGQQEDCPKELRLRLELVETHVQLVHNDQISNAPLVGHSS
jgi:hypothetical protein